MDKIRTIRDRMQQEYKLTSDYDQQSESDSIWSTLHGFGISKEDETKS